MYKMQDGRVFTDYNPSCSLNKFLQNKFNTSNSHEYRYYLQKNADNVRDDFHKCAMRDVNECVLCPVCNNAVSWSPDKKV